MKISKTSIQATKPKSIPILDKPLSEGGKIEYLALDDFEKRLGIKFDEIIDISKHPSLNPSDIKDDISGNLNSKQLISQLETILEQPRTDLALCKINDQVGYGIFALNDIPKDTLLYFFSGTLIPATSVRIKNIEQEDEHGIAYQNLNVMFSCNNFRGMASFFQHLPTVPKIADSKIYQKYLESFGYETSETEIKLEKELYAVEFKNGKSIKDIATENIRREYINYKGFPVVLMVTNENIKKGQQLGFNYGYRYWLSRGKVPLLFGIQGSIFLADNYRRTSGQLKFDNFTYYGEFSPLIEQIKKGYKEIEIYDAASKTKRFIAAEIAVVELIHVNALTQEEVKIFQNKTKSTAIPFSIVSENELTNLIKIYKLPNTNQESLEKGLRNAANNNKVEDLKIFIKYVKNINAKDSNPKTYRTSLHWAAIKGNEECYNILKNSGADASITDAGGKTPIEYLNTYLSSKSEIKYQLA